MENSRILMCPTDFLRIDYEINARMDKEKPPSGRLARQEWQGLVKEYIALGAELWFIEPDPDCQDMCFTANSGWARWGKIILANFTGKAAKARQAEVIRYQEWFSKYRAKLLGVEVVSWPALHRGFVGQGDVITVGQDKTNTVVLMGYGQGRTDYESHAIITAVHGLEKDQVLPVRLIDPLYYDLDMACWYILPSATTPETLVYYSGAFDAVGRRMIDSLPLPAENKIAVGEEDANNFVCNSVAIGNEQGMNLIMNRPTTYLQHLLRERGFTIAIVNMHEIPKNGGGPRCLSLFLPEE